MRTMWFGLSWSYGISLYVPSLEFQCRSTWEQQEIQLTASTVAAKAPIKTYRAGSSDELLQFDSFKVPKLKLGYLNMQLSGQNSSYGAAQVTEEAVEGDGSS